VNQIQTKGIILSRTNFGEADKIVSILTPDQGKISLIAKGVKKSRSKLAGGVELFSISELSYINGKSDLGTLISARLITHYGDIVSDIDRVQQGYDVIKIMNRATEDRVEVEYFDLLQNAFIALNEKQNSLSLIRIWFLCHLLKLGGHSPNLMSDADGENLNDKKKYNFDFETMSFIKSNHGRFKPSNLKLLRLLFSELPPKKLMQVVNVDAIIDDVSPLVQTIVSSYIRV
jgi:DNA repair protein RecO (recombination protein O)